MRMIFKKRWLFVYLFFCGCYFLPHQALAQSSYSIKGLLTDSASVNKLENSRILLLNAKDSILATYTKAKADGSFVVTNIPAGEYILLITYPGYADYVDRFKTDPQNKIRDFGTIYLTNKVILLKEVLIRGRDAIKANGDTTEFNVENFVIQPNSKVEDLLKQLPGIEVNKDGKIRAQGQTVDKVLVDGEEFFGDDPTVVTRNIRGDMVDKIQLYDKKSDQATLTGIDDGKTKKTLNVVLKEDSKIGYFGNVNLGHALNNLYEAQVMLNAFKPKAKLAVYGNFATTGKTGPDFIQGNKFGTVPTSVSTVDGVTGFFDELEGTGQYNGRGLPIANTSGIHHDSKWGSHKESINANYRIGSIQTDGIEDILTQQILSGNATSTKTNNSFLKYNFRQKADAVYQVELSPTSLLKLTLEGNLKEFKNENTMQSERKLENGSLLTSQLNKLLSSGNQQSLSYNLTWTKKFKKQGRTLNVGVSQYFSDKNTDSYQNSSSTFYESTGLNDVKNIDFYQVRKSDDLNTNATLGYSEAISKTWALYLSYTANIAKNTFYRKTLNKSESGIYNLTDPSLSNDLDYKQVSNQGGIILNYRKEKTTVNLGLNMINVAFHQLDQTINQHYNRVYTNFNTQLNYAYNFTSQRRLRFYYNGNTIQPRIDQLQPIKIVDDPLNIVIGNPDLKPAFNNRINATYSAYQPLSAQSISLSGSYSITADPFTQSFNTDDFGKTTIQTVNIPDKSSSEMAFSAEIGRKIKRPEIQVSLSLASNISKSYDVVNSELNTKNYTSFSGGIRFSKEKENRYSYTLRLNSTFNSSKQLIRNLTDKNFVYNLSTAITQYLPYKTEFNTDLSYTYTKADAFTGIINPVIVNVSLSKKFLKNENLKFSVTCNNLLDHNPGFIRRPNYQSTYSTIRRYFLLSIIWDFSKMGAIKQN